MWHVEMASVLSSTAYWKWADNFDCVMMPPIVSSDPLDSFLQCYGIRLLPDRPDIRRNYRPMVPYRTVTAFFRVLNLFELFLFFFQSSTLSRSLSCLIITANANK